MFHTLLALALCLPPAEAGKKSRSTHDEAPVEAVPREDSIERARVLTARATVIIAENVKAPDPAALVQGRSMLEEAEALAGEADWLMLSASSLLHLLSKQPEPALIDAKASLQEYAAHPPDPHDNRVLGGASMVALALLSEHRDPAASLELSTLALALELPDDLPDRARLRGPLRKAQGLAIQILDSPSEANHAILVEATEEFPGDPDLLLTLAILQVRHAPDEVDQTARRALAAGADPGNLHRSLARAWWILSQELNFRSSGLPDGPKAEALFIESTAAMARARPHLEAALAASPDEPEILRMLIRACQAGGDHEAAQRWVDQLAAVQGAGG